MRSIVISQTTDLFKSICPWNESIPNVKANLLVMGVVNCLKKCNSLYRQFTSCKLQEWEAYCSFNDVKAGFHWWQGEPPYSANGTQIAIKHCDYPVCYSNIDKGHHDLQSTFKFTINMKIRIQESNKDYKKSPRQDNAIFFLHFEVQVCLQSSFQGHQYANCVTYFKKRVF